MIKPHLRFGIDLISLRIINVIFRLQDDYMKKDIGWEEAKRRKLASAGTVISEDTTALPVIPEVPLLFARAFYFSISLITVQYWRNTKCLLPSSKNIAITFNRVFSSLSKKFISIHNLVSIATSVNLRLGWTRMENLRWVFAPGALRTEIFLF